MKKLSIKALRKQVNNRIDKADEMSLRRVNAILEIDQQDFWDELPSHVKNDITEAFQQSERGEGKPHEKVMKARKILAGKLAAESKLVQKESSVSQKRKQN